LHFNRQGLLTFALFTQGFLYGGYHPGDINHRGTLGLACSHPGGNVPRIQKERATAQSCHSKIAMSFASNSSTTVGGTLSNLRALREARSRARGWWHRTTPVVCVPAPVKDTAKPAVRAKLPPLNELSSFESFVLQGLKHVSGLFEVNLQLLAFNGMKYGLL
jgi:hypothetical protein